ncbi:hypothetical protein ONS95_009505 [Cadophora gregata]|uniref:uncharacterized protein n=1 Tax=Cadophora gregata TaxID=51156 RepID=UPI0026DD508F|nr:uncharacterized protein ONS95_009505 [Cadophora gregata]KAK0124557.1 hypothetical protein ONS95_009505 [Cadophora gregata]
MQGGPGPSKRPPGHSGKRMECFQLARLGCCVDLANITVVRLQHSAASNFKPKTGTAVAHYEIRDCLVQMLRAIKRKGKGLSSLTVSRLLPARSRPRSQFLCLLVILNEPSKVPCSFFFLGIRPLS